MKKPAILVLNAGSSSIKFAVISADLPLTKLYYGMVDQIKIAPEIKLYNNQHDLLSTKKSTDLDYEKIIVALFALLQQQLTEVHLVAAGHRVVHGGVDYLAPILIDDLVITGLTKLIDLAPLHQPYNLQLINAVKKLHPNLPQIACFDTSFHATQPWITRKFAISTALFEEGVMRYGFHGLSYEYISSVLGNFLPNNLSKGKIIVAHLGNGASVCALSDGRSIGSSMGFTALEGLMMGTRCGNIDPGVILYLQGVKKLNLEQITKLLYSNSGLLGVSGISSDVRVLENSKDPKAVEALQLFGYRAAREMLALTTILQGLDGLVFTAGIGENSALIRQYICSWLNWLGVDLDLALNQRNQTIISSKDSKVVVAVIPTNEELMIAKHTKQLLNL